MRYISKSGPPSFYFHAGPAIAATLQACFRLLVALAIAAIVAGALLALTLAAWAAPTLPNRLAPRCCVSAGPPELVRPQHLPPRRRPAERNHAAGIHPP